jgi:rhodanese-related sulfurtransferase
LEAVGDYFAHSFLIGWVAAGNFSKTLRAGLHYCYRRMHMLATDAAALLGTGLFVDVREADEYDAGHIEGSIHIPIGDIARRWRELETQRPVVVVCQVGQRSGLVTNFLRERSVDAHNLEGGLSAWSEAGLALAAAAPHPQLIDGWARDLSGERLAPP